MMDNAFGNVEIRLSPETTTKLRQAASAANVTMNTLLQGAWAILLSRLSNERDIVFGATRACRKSGVPGARDIVGILINTLPVRINVNGTADLGEWLRTIRDQSIATRAHEHTPLNRVQGWSDIERGRPLSKHSSFTSTRRSTRSSRRLEALGNSVRSNTSGKPIFLSL